MLVSTLSKNHYTLLTSIYIMQSANPERSHSPNLFNLTHPANKIIPKRKEAQKIIPMFNTTLTPSELEERNQLILELSHQFTYAEIGRKLGLSRERVRVIAQREAKRHNLSPTNLRNSRKDYDVLVEKVLKTISEIQSEYGFIPSQSEISLRVGAPQPRISRLLRRLKQQGVLKPLHGARLYIINENRAPRSTATGNAEAEKEGIR